MKNQLKIKEIDLFDYYYNISKFSLDKPYKIKAQDSLNIWLSDKSKTKTQVLKKIEKKEGGF